MQLTNSNPCNHPTAMGTPCRRAAIRGGTRCTLHGGGTPEARRVAQEMLAVARVPAARALLQIIEDFSQAACATCGRGPDPNPVIKAAIAVLDRTGLHPTRHQINGEEQDDGSPWLAWQTDEELEEVVSCYQRVEVLNQRAKARMAAGEPRFTDMKVIDTRPVAVSSALSPTGTELVVSRKDPKHD